MDLQPYSNPKEGWQEQRMIESVCVVSGMIYDCLF